METTILIANDQQSLHDLDTNEIRPFSIYNSREGRPTEISAIVAADRNNAIGRGGDIPWHISEDFKRFKALTLGHPVIMGRRTWESLPKRPLPGRRNIVVTSDSGYEAPGAEVALSPLDALGLCAADESPFVIGGASIYAALLPYCTRLFLTRVETEVEGADTYMPQIDDREWQLAESDGPHTASDGLQYTFLNYRRV